jgi:uncharacterized protein (DUF1697 family)
MATVVFMRGVNVGGRRKFRPAALAKELSALGVVSIGAAGTFIVRKKVNQAVLRTEFLHRLPFEPELMICKARDLIDLVSADPFVEEAADAGVRRFVSVLARRTSRRFELPLIEPEVRAWQVKVLGVQGRFAVSLWRRTGKAIAYPNEVVEKHLAVPATTRNWDTISKVCKILLDD